MDDSSGFKHQDWNEVVLKKPISVETKKHSSNNHKTKAQQQLEDNDIVAPPKMSQELAKMIKNSEYVEIPNGKHLCNIECSEVFNKALEKFIDKNYEQI